MQVLEYCPFLNPYSVLSGSRKLRTTNTTKQNIARCQIMWFTDNHGSHSFRHAGPAKVKTPTANKMTIYFAPRVMTTTRVLILLLEGMAKE